MRTFLAPLITLAILLAAPVALAGVAEAAGGLSPAPRGGAVWPLATRPAVVDPFDPPTSRWGAGHRGVDLAGAAGEQVRAVLPGTVTYAAVLAGRGVVVVDHGATRTTYEPVAALVRVGDRVAAGRPIGRLTLRGSHCLPAACLHWGWRRGEAYLDPLDLVGAAPVRLLPWEGRSAALTGPPLRGTAQPGGRAVPPPPAGASATSGDPVLALAVAGGRAGGLGAGDRGVRRAGGPGGTPPAAGHW